MSNISFMKSPSMLFTSESVTEGHPDKLCDQISDGVLDAILSQDPQARVACETATTTGLVIVMGEITADCQVEVPTIVRDIIRSIGYTDSSFGLDANSVGTIVSLKGQSPDIDLGVSSAHEKSVDRSDDRFDEIGAGDQGMMIGFACDEDEELMPLPIVLAHRICRELANARKSGTLEYLRPDGKAQVTVEYRYGKPARIDTVLVSAQHDAEVGHDQIKRDVINHVVKKVVQNELLDENTRFLVNPTGRFVVGGPMGDTGLTGRKIIVDTYGGMARHGGGAFSGKDPTKVDRSSSYAARHVAKNIVAAGLARRVEVQLAYAIGVAKPISTMVETFGTAVVPEEQIVRLIERHFDLRPAAIIENLNLRRPIYQATASYGHFGRSDIDAPWEITDKADLLRSEAGL